MQFKSTQNNFKKSTFKVLPFILNFKCFFSRVVHASQIREQFYVSVAWNDFECFLGGSMVLICYWILMTRTRCQCYGPEFWFQPITNVGIANDAMGWMMMMLIMNGWKMSWNVNVVKDFLGHIFGIIFGKCCDGW